MEISSVGGNAFTPEIQSQYAIKLMQMARESEQVAGNVLQDTVEISKEAMAKFLGERKV